MAEDHQHTTQVVTLAVAGMACLIMGLVMLLHGMGLITAAWFHPNPLTPHWVLIMLGAMLLVGTVLIFNQLVRLPHNMVTLSGYSFFAGSLVMANWLVLFSVGGQCGVSAFGLTLFSPAMLCRLVMEGVVLVFDLLLVLLAFSAWRKSKPD
jgi:hypothetical protein